MHRFKSNRLMSILILLGICGCDAVPVPNPFPSAAMLLHSTNGELFRMNLDSLKATYIGETGLTLWDIAIDADGKLWGITNDSDLYAIDPNNAAIEYIGPVGTSSLSSLVYDRGRSTLFAVSEYGALVRIDRATGAGTQEMNLGNHGSSGDLAIGRGGELLLTTNNGKLIAINVEQKTTQIRGSLPNSTLWALDRAPDGRLIGIDSQGVVYEIEEADASARRLGELQVDFTYTDVGGGSF